VDYEKLNKTSSNGSDSDCTNCSIILSEIHHFRPVLLYNFFDGVKRKLRLSFNARGDELCNKAILFVNSIHLLELIVLQF
jgi:hypothetical protein